LCWFRLASAVRANVGGRSRERRKRLPGAAPDYALRELPKTTLVPRIWVHKPSACGVAIHCQRHDRHEGSEISGTKVVLVTGHTACGAIKGAIDQVQLGNLTGPLAKIQPAVDATSNRGERSAKNYGFVDAVARKNVELTVAEIRSGSAVIAEPVRRGSARKVRYSDLPAELRLAVFWPRH
jgi:hypothetical protein